VKRSSKNYSHMNNKNIWIINEYAGSPSYGMTFRHYYLAKEFDKLGYRTTVISGAYSHFLKQFPQMEDQRFKTETVDGVDFLWIKVMKYSRSFDKKRVLKWFEFMFKLFVVDRHIDDQPDIIICSPSAPFSILPAYYLAKKHKAKLVFEVRDIWPLTLMELGGFSKWNPLIVLMEWFEKFALTKSDFIVSNLPNYKLHAEERNVSKKVYWIPNGIDLGEMENVKPLEEDIVQKIPKDKFIIGYTGKLGVSNAISYLIEAAKLLQDNHNIFFVIVGQGQEKENLMEQSGMLQNVLFIDTIEKMQIQSMLHFFDVCYLGLQKEKLFRYGISPNKLFDYMYAAKPILFAVETSNNIVDTAKCGLTVEAENVEMLKEAIEKLSFENRKKLDKMGQNAKAYVINHYNYSILAKKYINILEGREGERI